MRRADFALYSPSPPAKEHRMQIHPYGQFDNHARAYAHIEAHPLAAAMGAEICGVDLADPSDAQFEEIRDALFRHKMIYFRGQPIDHAAQEAFSARFGRFAEDAYTVGVAGHRNVQPLVKEADARTGHIFGSGWHTDSPFLAEPPAITILRSAPRCAIMEHHRAALQPAFPDRKVFAQRTFCEDDIENNVSYTGVSDSVSFLAVYAGRSRDDADAMLAGVQRSAAYPGANLRRMQAVFHFP